MSQRVATVVVTYNRKALLKECIAALLSQTRSIDKIIILDNASVDGTLEMMHDQGLVAHPTLEYVRLPENVGGAGGFHEGMKRACDYGYDFVWLMDDDAVPHPNALAALLEHSQHADVVISTQVDTVGLPYGASVEIDGWIVSVPLALGFGLQRTVGFSFVGPLISRHCINAIGLPRSDFFIAGDDVEYALRLARAGFTALMVERSIIFHEYGGVHNVRRFLWRKSRRQAQPNWKSYYEARNRTFITRTYARRTTLASIRLLSDLVRLTIGDLLYEPGRFPARLRYRTVGIVHALYGRLGCWVKP